MDFRLLRQLSVIPLLLRQQKDIPYGVLQRGSPFAYNYVVVSEEGMIAPVDLAYQPPQNQIRVSAGS